MPGSKFGSSRNKSYPLAAERRLSTPNRTTEYRIRASDRETNVSKT